MFSKKALEGVRVLDLTNEMGVYAAKLFADMGAEVIRVELPTTESLRHMTPFINDNQSLESSIAYQFFNTNKKSISLDITQIKGREVFLKLLETSHILIETNAPGFMAELGLGYEELKERYPHLVYTSITAFGQSGPYKDYSYSPLVGLAMGGLLYLGGYPDSEPIAACADQAHFAAALYGAVGTMLALLHAEWTGEGQYVDVSMQEAVAMALENSAQYYEMEGIIRKRQGVSNFEAGMGLYPCQDGYIYMIASGLGERSWDALTQWMKESWTSEGFVLEEKCWQDPAYRKTEEAKQRFTEEFIKFSKTLTKAELYEEGQRRRIPICPVNTPEDISNSPQLQSREFFQTLYHERLGTDIVLPGAPYRLSETPWEIKSMAPSFNQDSKGILLGLGYSLEEIELFTETGVV
jgi:benzylsuccinate CoA-transferase BbsE subunit